MDFQNGMGQTSESNESSPNRFTRKGGERGRFPVCLRGKRQAAWVWGSAAIGVTLEAPGELSPCQGGPSQALKPTHGGLPKSHLN